jgi:hypothetical protein
MEPPNSFFPHSFLPFLPDECVKNLRHCNLHRDCAAALATSVKKWLQLPTTGLFPGSFFRLVISPQETSIAQVSTKIHFLIRLLEIIPCGQGCAGACLSLYL